MATGRRKQPAVYRLVSWQRFSVQYGNGNKSLRIFYYDRPLQLIVIHALVRTDLGECQRQQQQTDRLNTLVRGKPEYDHHARIPR